MDPDMDPDRDPEVDERLEGAANKNKPPDRTSAGAEAAAAAVCTL